MSHVYATVDALARLMSGGARDRDPEMLTVLESASRAVDAFCNRGSGFGPVTETRSYTAHRSHVHLRGDLIALDSLTLDGTAVDPTPSLTARTRRLSGYSGTAWDVAGSWSYDYQVQLLEPLAAGMADDDAALETEAPALYSPGMTVLVDEEQLLVTAVGEIVEPATTASVTVVRGANGTTAAAHLQAAAVTQFRYAQEAVDATLRIAQRRWRSRDAGLTGAYGGEGVPVTAQQDTEWAILLGTVNHLRFLGVW